MTVRKPGVEKTITVTFSLAQCNDVKLRIRRDVWKCMFHANEHDQRDGLYWPSNEHCRAVILPSDGLLFLFLRRNLPLAVTLST